MRGATRTASVLLALAAAACGSSQAQVEMASDPPLPPPTDSQMVRNAPDGTFVSISGRVVQTDDSDFTLDYGDGEIVVEMDDWDAFPEARDLLVDDDVVVYGYVDDDFRENRTIEASSVYVKGLGTQFYASGVDEEDVPSVTVVDFHPRVEISGTVTDVSEDEFTLQTGAGTFEVDTEALPYDPLDDDGFQRISRGDRVRVGGALSSGVFDDADLMADTVVTLESGESGHSS